MSVRIGIDTGGTFTDVVLYDDESGAVEVTKTPSTPPEFDQGVLAGLDAILEAAEVDPHAVSFLSHGTTVGTNAVLEGDLPDLGLITNAGLRDVLEIGDQTRPELYNLQQDKHPALIRRARRRGVRGRINYAGEVIEPLDEDDATSVIDDLIAEDVDSIVVSLLFSHLNDAHERRIGELIADQGAEFALSSAVYPEPREFDRTVTTVLNEAVKTRISAYFDRLSAGIADRGVDVPLNVMHSGGGIFGVDQATKFALRTALSGPAAGAVAARHVAGDVGAENAIGLDMGGTSADVSITERGELVRSVEGEINDLPIKTPLIDINTVGAGGGSIAWIDRGGGLRVGPRSAGADPGPICYGRGGTEPTVTDANLLLGRIDPGAFAGGVDLAVDATRAEFETAIAEPLGESVESAALSVLQVANARMAREIRRVTVERGRDPDDFALVAFGGAGPLHAPAVAKHMDMTRQLVPPSPGVLSARGLLLADVRTDESQAYRGGGEIAAEQLESGYGELEARQLDRFSDMGFDEDAVRLDRALDMRYTGQSYELTVPVPAGELDDDAVATVEARFHEEHERLYGHAMAEEPVEAVTLRVTAVVPTPAIEDRHAGARTTEAGDPRRVYFEDHGYMETATYRRDALAVGSSIDGPAIVEEPGSTTLLPPGTHAVMTDTGILDITLDG